MPKMTQFLLTVGLTLVLTGSVFSDDACHTSQLAKCADIAINWLHGLPKKSIPESEDQVDTACTELKKAINCASSFRDSCTTPLQKEIIGLLGEGVIDFVKDFCTSGSKSRQQYLSHSTCLNKLSQTDDVKKQIEYILAVVENINYKEKKDLIMYGCCGYRKIRTHIEKLGTEQCGKEAKDAALDLISMVVAQLPDVVCTGMDGSESKCTELLPPDGTTMSDKAQQTAAFKYIHNALKNWLE